MATWQDTTAADMADIAEVFESVTEQLRAVTGVEWSVDDLAGRCYGLTAFGLRRGWITATPDYGPLSATDTPEMVQGWTLCTFDNYGDQVREVHATAARFGAVAAREVQRWSAYKYCGRVQLQHYGDCEMVRGDSIAQMVERFRWRLHEARGWRDDAACSLTIYATDGAPCECDSACNFHDYPMALFEVGPRGGVRETAV